jgi:hypothetical protein
MWIRRGSINHVCFSADGEWLLIVHGRAGFVAESVSAIWGLARGEVGWEWAEEADLEWVREWDASVALGPGMSWTCIGRLCLGLGSDKLTGRFEEGKC